jgi:transposase
MRRAKNEVDSIIRRDTADIAKKEESADKKRKPGYKARRWVVERTHSWLNRFRKLLVGFERTEQS